VIRAEKDRRRSCNLNRSPRQREKIGSPDALQFDGDQIATCVVVAVDRYESVEALIPTAALRWNPAATPAWRLARRQ
jgi:ASC-1-like (ASCH) protein